jgi:hypothetical protein
MTESDHDLEETVALARAAGLQVPPERLETLVDDLAAARAMMAEVRSIATEPTPVTFRPDWSEPTGEMAQ